MKVVFNVDAALCEVCFWMHTLFIRRGIDEALARTLRKPRYWPERRS